MKPETEESADPPVRDVPSHLLMAHFCVSQSTLTAWNRAGCPGEFRGKRKYYNLEEVRAWMKSVGRDGQHGGDRKSGADPEIKAELIRARIRTTVAQAQKAELALARERGELIPREEVERDWLERITWTRQKLLSGPAFLFPDDPENQTRMREWVLAILKEFAGE